jgi:hypothetical protein
MKAGLVLTTIFDPICLDGYFENFKKFGHLEQVEVFVSTDARTPQVTYLHCEALRKKGLKISCEHYHLEAAEFVKSIGLKPEMFPLNSDNRRNIGYLQALAAGCDFIISIDDDNYCLPDKDYFAGQEVCLTTAQSVSEEVDGWYNPCSLLNVGLTRVFQRGFPYYKRQSHLGGVHFKAGNFNVHANQGLWFSDPDIDAMSWLVTPVKSYPGQPSGLSMVLGQKTWAPVNSQNTAVRAEAIPAYYFIPMGWRYGGAQADRFGDIFQGYFLQKCMKHLGGHLRIGSPFVDHRRNSHVYFTDVEKELPCIMLLEEMLPWLTDERTELSGSDYCEAYLCLASMLEEWVMRDVNPQKFALTAGLSKVSLFDKMRSWVKACRTIGVGKVAA